jgi:hypothetical protein
VPLFSAGNGEIFSVETREPVSGRSDESFSADGGENMKRSGNDAVVISVIPVSTDRVRVEAGEREAVLSGRFGAPDFLRKGMTLFGKWVIMAG